MTRPSRNQEYLKANSLDSQNYSHQLVEQLRNIHKNQVELVNGAESQNNLFNRLKMKEKYAKLKREIAISLPKNQESRDSNSKFQRYILKQLETVMDDSKRLDLNKQQNSSKICKNQNKLALNNTQNLSTANQKRQYVFAHQAGYKQGHIRSSMSNSIEKAKIYSYIAEREKLRDQKDIMKWQNIQQKQLKAIQIEPQTLNQRCMSLGNQFTNKNGKKKSKFSKAMRLLKEKNQNNLQLSEQRNQDLVFSQINQNSKLNRRNLSIPKSKISQTINPTTKQINSYQIAFCSEAKDALKSKYSAENLQNLSANSRGLNRWSEGRSIGQRYQSQPSKVNDLISICDQVLQRRMGKDFQKRKQMKQFKFIRRM